MIERLVVDVYGEAVPQGSKTRTRYGVREDRSEDLKSWRGAIAKAAAEAFTGDLIAGPIKLESTFYRVRKGDPLRRDGLLNAAARALRYLIAPAIRPDLGKVARAVQDALTGVVYTDDALIVWEDHRKLWGGRQRVRIRVFELEPSDLGDLYGGRTAEHDGASFLATWRTIAAASDE